MPIIFKTTGERVDKEIVVVQDQSGHKVILASTDRGFRILNPSSLGDSIPTDDFVGGNIDTPYLRIRGDTIFPVKRDRR